MIPPADLKQTLEDGLPEATVEVRDLTGTQDHYAATIVWSGFEGVRLLARHRKIYEVLGALMDGPVHALTLQTVTPAEHDAQQGKG